MFHLKDLKGSVKKALIITAHPDDESLFMGGTIAEFRRWRWTVLCVTDCDERYNKRRRGELLRACRIYNKNGSHVTPIMLGITEKKEITRKIRDFIDRSGPFDVIFTHNSKGDYGHRTHKLIHDAAGKLRLRKIYNFYLPPYKKSPITPRMTQTIDLSPKSRRTKRAAINVYSRGSQKTNLSRLKRLVQFARNTDREWFISAN